MKLHRLILLCCALSGYAQEPVIPTEFRVTSAFPKYVTADLEFRDPTGVKWPTFLYGKPANDTGKIVLDTAKPTAAFALLCDKAAQDKGDQSRRVLGSLTQPITATLTITAVGALGPVEKPKSGKPAHSAEMTGTLEIGGKKIPVKAKTNLVQHDGKGDEKNRALMLDGQFSLKGTDLGLPALANIDVRFGLTAYPVDAATTQKK